MEATYPGPDRIHQNRPRRSAVSRGGRQAFQQAVQREPGLRPAGQLDRSGGIGGRGGGEGRTASRRDEWRALPRGIRIGSRGAGDHRCLAHEARVLRRGDGRRGRRGRRHGGRDVPGAVRDVGSGDTARRVSGDRHGRACGRWRLWLPLPPARPRGGLSVCRRGGHRGRGRTGEQRGGDAGDVRPESRPLVGAYRRGRRQLRRRHPVLVPIAWRIRRGSRQAVAPRAGVDHDLQGGMELERHRPAVLPATPQEPRDLVRAKQRRRFPVRLALDPPGDPSQAVREDHRPRCEHGRRRRRAAGG